jgi:hypothetical protein
MTAGAGFAALARFGGLTTDELVEVAELTCGFRRGPS